MSVYWIQPGDLPFVKIGWAMNPRERCRDLQVGNHEVLRIIRVLECTQAAEGALRRHFAEHRTIGEWFHLQPEMLTITLDELNVPGPRLVATDPLLDQIETFLLQNGMTATPFGVQALGDPQFVPELRRGRECRRATRNRVLSFMASSSQAAA